MGREDNDKFCVVFTWFIVIFTIIVWITWMITPVRPCYTDEISLYKNSCSGCQIHTDTFTGQRELHCDRCQMKESLDRYNYHWGKSTTVKLECCYEITNDNGDLKCVREKIIRVNVEENKKEEKKIVVSY